VTDSTSCGICRLDLTAAAPEPVVPTEPEPAAQAGFAPSEDEATTETLPTMAAHDAVTNEPVEVVAAAETVEAVEATSTEATPAPNFEPAQAPVFEPRAVAAPVFASPVEEDPAVEEVVVDESAVEAEPVVEAPGLTADAEDSSAVDMFTGTTEDSRPVNRLVEPMPVDVPAEAAAVGVPDAPYAPAASGPAHAAPSHHRMDPRALQAPTGLSGSVAILGGLQALTLGLSVFLAWWAVRQVQSTLDSVFTFDPANPDSSANSLGGLNSALATAGASALAALVSIALTLGVLVCLMVWTSKTRTVADAVSPGQHRLSSLWSVIGWIIPFVSLVLPLLAVSDLYKSADPRTAGTRGRFTGSIPRVVMAWWGAYVISWVLLVVQRVSGGTSVTSIAAVPTFSSLQWLWLASTLASTVFMIVVVRRISGWQADQLINAVSTHSAVQAAADPRFGSDWNDTAPIASLPFGGATHGELASAGPMGSQSHATQAYEPPNVNSLTSMPPAPSIDQARINPRDPFSFPPPGQSI